MASRITSHPRSMHQCTWSGIQKAGKGDLVNLFFINLKESL